MHRAVTTVLASLLLPAATCDGPEPPPAQGQCDINPDQDRDGERSLACGGTDCDDTNALRSPSQLEVCDAADVDEDCDPTTFGARDTDADGFIDAACSNIDADGTIAAGDDCDDARPDVHPGAAEFCDGRDNNCSGAIDEGALRTFYVDLDGDGHGDPLGVNVDSCDLVPGYAFTADDCDDAAADRNPGAPEVCDGRDNNCNAETDEGVQLTLYVDEDHDGFGTTETVLGCAEGGDLAARPGDCDDTNAALVNGSMRCVDGLQYQICDDGVWSAAVNCSVQQCFTQPNGVGQCR